MKCPRRNEIGGSSVFKLPDGDTYKTSHGTCSYCGSMNPDEFMERLENGTLKVEPTDKSYKVYVSAEGLQAIKFYFQHLSREQCQRFVELYNEGKVPCKFYVMPFFMSIKRTGTLTPDEAL